MGDKFNNKYGHLFDKHIIEVLITVKNNIGWINSSNTLLIAIDELNDFLKFEVNYINKLSLPRA
ncbi:MAG: hypothetical protein LBL77_02500 [Endomicrobium sp.]|jgi:hypothetical protein|nr:hypothetical protein [Endomicrobium sp.]